MKTTEKKKLEFRCLLVGALFTLFMGAIAAKAAYIQIYRGSWLSQKAASQYEKTLRTAGNRGTIYDRHGHLLAAGLQATSIGAFPGKIKDLPAVADQLAEALQMNPQTLRTRLSNSDRFIWIKRQATPAETTAVKKMGAPGIEFLTDHSRFYPNRALAAQVIGFTGIDGEGLEGLEYLYDNELRGENKNRQILHDAFGNGFEDEDRGTATFTGNKVFLTIDSNIQYITETQLQAACETNQAKSGIAIVMDPFTGDVLALAHYPKFNPNSFRRYRQETWRNRAITDPFEPGSTMKIFTAAAAVELNACHPETIFYCENGNYQIGRHRVHDIKPHGDLTLGQIIQYSSNIGAVKIGEAIGNEPLHRMLSAFGFGRKTGIDCPGETSGSLPDYRIWSPVDAGAIAFGQGVSVSAIQMTAAVAAIANGGVLMKPRIVSKITDPWDREIKSFRPQTIRRVISGETAAQVRKMMWSAVNQEGTGANAALKGYAVCGKTGTAQKIDETGAYAKDKFIASFIGFTPLHRPSAVILVVIDEPEKNHYGGWVAAPAFRKIALEMLGYLNVTPEPEGNHLVRTVSHEVNG